ncbi:MAG: hypothetical protein DMG11_19785 [Acidobacteria bacterium]|nr:MAG: hypothetical protein DMG11_19785 [Acidobacteriota bacterium]
MDQLTAVCRAIDVSALRNAVSGFNQTWALIQTLHLAAMSVLVASITTFDLRLLGLAMKRVSVSRLADRLLPATWSAFAVMMATGGLMFAGQAPKYCVNWIFLTKVVLIVLAGLNMAIFHFTVYRSVSKWDETATTPLSAKLVGTFSVLLWASVVVAGRWIGFIA